MSWERDYGPIGDTGTVVSLGPGLYLDRSDDFWQTRRVPFCSKNHSENLNCLILLAALGCTQPGLERMPVSAPDPLAIAVPAPVLAEPVANPIVEAGQPPAFSPPQLLPPPEDVVDGRAVLTNTQNVRRAAREIGFPLHGVAFHHLAQVFTEPDTSAGIRGYLRRGNRFRAKVVEGGNGCGRPWYAVDGGGFVCAGRGFIVGKTSQTFPGAPTLANTQAALPYRYAKSMFSDVPQYYALPSPEDEAWVERAIQERTDGGPDASGQVERFDGGAGDGGVGGDPLPTPVRALMQPGFYVSFDRIEETLAGKAFVRTVRGAYVALDRLKEVAASPNHGVSIADGLRRPMAFVFHSKAATFRAAPDGESLLKGDPIPKFAVVSPRGPRVFSHGTWLVGIGGGRFVKSKALRSVTLRDRPALVPTQGQWIDVDLGQQVLVAYEGDVPVFATLIASGKAGFETPTGFFRIHAKHLSTTMDGSGGRDEPYSIEDVPWTMYFHGSIALHAAFWHERFGRVRSHGCINLTPRDARHLFQWATPERPHGFHGVMGEIRRHGTYVSIHHG